jgi:GT2 family glycosyltransferase
MVRSDIIRTVGGMDEQFFLYFEEVDWCMRMHRAGYAVYVCPSAVVTHFANAELGHFDAHRLVHYHRSLILFYKKHYSATALRVLRVLVACRSLLRIAMWALLALVRPSIQGRALSSLRGYVRVLRLMWVT